MRSLFAEFCVLLVFSSSTFAQQQVLDNQERKAVVEKISLLVIDNYVFEEVGKKSADFIQSQLEAGAYKDMANRESFAKKLTEHLQSINHDKHMRVRPTEAASQQREDPEAARARSMRRHRERNFGFEKVERLEGNVGYLDMRYFAGTPKVRETAAAAMKFLVNADALIFDMRKNGGGSPDAIQYICSYLFGEKTHLNSLYWRRGDRTDEFWTLDEIDGKRMPDIPVFVLTSRRTFSGAEEFSYNLQTRERATLIGETTGGGANPGGTMPINDHFGIFIPTGRAINPVTGTNWEGVGVKPDIDVPADSALAVALPLAQKAAQSYRKKQIAQETKRRETRKAKLYRAQELMAAKKKELASKLVNEALQPAIQSGDLDEPLVNMLGYQHIQNNPALAVAILKFNAESFPDSPNVYDSLGDAYKANSELENAKHSYETAYKIGLDKQDPNVEIFKKNIKEIQKLLAEN